MREDELKRDLAAALGLGVVLFYRREIVATAKDLVSRGTRLTTTSLVGPTKGKRWVTDDPSDLTAQAQQVFGQDLAHDPYTALGIYSLARMSRSEAGPRDGDESRKARMHVALNDADAIGWALPRLFTFSKQDQADGLFGEQGGRRYSTAKDPYAGDILLAWEAVDEHNRGIDPTGGAVKFVDKDSMGKQPGTGTFAELVERWSAENLVPYNIDGLGSNFVVFRREA